MTGDVAANRTAGGSAGEPWPPRALVFDCYGTLLEIVDRRNPYGRLAALAGGRLVPSPMIEPLTLRDVVVRNLATIKISAAELAELELDLEAEIASVTPIADVLNVLTRLGGVGYRIAVATNLAAPYSEPVRRLLSNLVDAQIFSFELGVMKPSAHFFQRVCERLKVRPADALMVGDSLANDYHGALSAGLQARHLRRGLTVREVLNDLL